jgi:hypothetical protein
MTLEQFLDTNVRIVRKLIAAVPPGGDIASMCSAFRNGQMIKVMPVEVAADHAKRRQQHTALMAWLRSLDADAYAWIAPAWRVTLAPGDVAAQQAAIAANGGVKNRPDREELVLCAVGDKTKTISVDLRVVRRADGTITDLQPEPSSKTSTGLFFDLLLEAPKVTN